MFDVKSQLVPVTVKWKDIGLALRLAPDKLDVIEAENQDINSCLTKTLGLWLKKNYDTKQFGEPSWKLLADAVAHPAGGNNCAVADNIIRAKGMFVALVHTHLVILLVTLCRSW